MMTSLGKCEKKKKEKNIFVLRDLLLSATFEEFLDKKNCFPLKPVSRRKKKQELILSGGVWKKTE